MVKTDVTLNGWSVFAVSHLGVGGMRIQVSCMTLKHQLSSPPPVKLSPASSLTWSGRGRCCGSLRAVVTDTQPALPMVPVGKMSLADHPAALPGTTKQ